MSTRLLLSAFLIVLSLSHSDAQAGSRAKAKPAAAKKVSKARVVKAKASAKAKAKRASSKNKGALNKLLQRKSAQQLRDKALGKKEAKQVRSAKPAYQALKAQKQKRQTGKARSVVITGGGPTGALAAIQAYHLGLDVTIVEQRNANTLPIIWNNRQQSREILKLIDPVLEGSLFSSNKLQSKAVLPGQKEPVSKPKGAGAEPHNDPFGIGRSPSTWQSQAKGEVTAYWNRLKQLEKAEAKQAKAEGREPRLKLYRGYQVTKLPSEKAEKRGVEIREMVTKLQKGENSRKPELKNGKPILRDYKGGRVPKGWSKVTLPAGKKVRLKAPDDLLVAEGANSATRKMAGAESIDVGPNTRFIAAYLEGVSFTGKKKGPRGKTDVARRDSRTTANGVILRKVALSPTGPKGIWALPEVDPKLNFDSPKSIQKYFGKAMSREKAVRTYYAQEIAPLVGKTPGQIANKISFGPGDFVLQSHVSGPVAKNASNVHLIGDARGNSHFLTSMGKVTGTGTHQLSLRRFWESVGKGTSENLASAILDKRLDQGTRAWLQLSVPEFVSAGTPKAGKAAAARLAE